MKKLLITLSALALAISLAHGSSLASDNGADPAYAGNVWTTATNGGVGFGAWSFGTTGAGGHFLGTTGDGIDSFGVFADPGDTSSADRQFTGALSDGQTFSLTIGNTVSVAAGGVIGLNLLSGTNVVLTIKFTGGDSAWAQNNGGSDFGIAQNFVSNTPILFSFTLVNGATKTYNYTFGTASGNGFIGSVGNYANITGVRVFNSAQGSGENVGINNLAIVPEPSALALIAGPAVLGAFFFARRRRA